MKRTPPYGARSAAGALVTLARPSQQDDSAVFVPSPPTFHSLLLSMPHALRHWTEAGDDLGLGAKPFQRCQRCQEWKQSRVLSRRSVA
jgi:hypothetical protein